MANKRSTSPRARLLLDSSAVIGFARGDLQARRILKAALKRGDRISIVPGTVAETVRGNGPHDARINRLIRKTSDVPAITEETGRVAGRLLARAGSDSTVDALLVAEAVIGGGAVIATSDVADIQRLADGQPNVHIIRV